MRPRVAGASSAHKGVLKRFGMGLSFRGDDGPLRARKIDESERERFCFCSNQAGRVMRMYVVTFIVALGLVVAGAIETATRQHGRVAGMQKSGIPLSILPGVQVAAAVRIRPLNKVAGISQ
jgi:hypothetical protein